MRNLGVREIQEVNGGNEGATSTTDDVRTNAQTAKETCGAGNVKSVTSTGFECHSTPGNPGNDSAPGQGGDKAPKRN